MYHPQNETLKLIFSPRNVVEMIEILYWYDRGGSG